MSIKFQHKEAAVYTLTKQGLILGQHVATLLTADLYAPARYCHELPLAGEIEKALQFITQQVGAGNFVPPAPTPVPFSELGKIIEDNFLQYKLHIFVTATGIAVRCIAPLLAGKSVDPAVLVVDQKGQFVISLLSGHIGKANLYAEKLARQIGATPVITTATDIEELPAIDSLATDRGLHIHNLGAIKYIQAALLNKEPVVLDDPDDWLDLKNYSRTYDNFIEQTALADSGYATIKVSPYVRLSQNGRRELLLNPPALYVGVGCRKGVTAKEIMDFVMGFFEGHSLSINSVVAFASVDIKQNESGLNEFAEQLGKPLLFYRADELGHMKLQTPSSKVQEILGIDGVCENSAMLAARRVTGLKSTLLHGKEKNKKITVAVAIGHGPAIAGYHGDSF